MNKFLFKCLIIANSSNYWAPHKQIFYRLKDKILQKYGRYDGKDVQKLKITCRKCDGTGVFGYWRHDGGEWCWDCNGSGIYTRKTYFLERYWVNNYLFHIPTYKPPEFGEFRGIITHRIKHKDYGYRAGNIAFKILLFRYNLKKWIKLIREKIIYKEKELLRKIYYMFYPFPNIEFKRSRYKTKKGNEYDVYRFFDIVKVKNKTGKMGRIKFIKKRRVPAFITELGLILIFEETVIKFRFYTQFERDLPF